MVPSLGICYLLAVLRDEHLASHRRHLLEFRPGRIEPIPGLTAHRVSYSSPTYAALNQAPDHSRGAERVARRVRRALLYEHQRYLPTGRIMTSWFEHGHL